MKKIIQKIKEGAQSVFGIDVRALAVFRIGIGVLLIANYLIKGGVIREFFTDSGIIPRGALIDLFLNKYKWSLHLISGELSIQVILFIVSASIAVLLIIGYRTRLMTILSWILLLSLHNRDPYILNSGDILLRELIFWSMFLPLGARWSVDAFWHKYHSSFTSPSPHHHHTHNIIKSFSIATTAILLQVVYVYFFTIQFKTDPAWRVDYTAAWQALQITYITTDFGRWLGQFTTILHYATIIVFYTFCVTPIALLSPIKTKIIRFFWIPLLIIIHFGFGSTIKVSLFDFVNFVSLIIFLPKEFWEWCEHKWHTLRPHHPIRNTLGHITRAWEIFLVTLRGDSFACAIYMEPKQKPYWRHVFGQMVVLIAFLYISIWNINDAWFHKRLPTWYKSIGYIAGLDQRWNMFAPRPLMTHGWITIDGVLKDNSHVDVLRHTSGTPDDKPQTELPSYLEQEPWRKFFIDYITNSSDNNLRLYYGKYLCRTWNKNLFTDKQLESFTIYWFKRTTHNSTTSEPKKTPIWEHNCFR